MDTKYIKEKLKSINILISNKEFKQANLICLEVLKDDPHNYMAFIFQGVAEEGIDNIENSLKCYNKAISIDDKQLLAWKGICQLCEKHPNLNSLYKIEFTNCFEKLHLLYNGNIEKQYENGYKYLKFLIIIKDYIKLIEVYNKIYSELSADINVYKLLMDIDIYENNIRKDLLIQILKACEEINISCDSNNEFFKPSWIKKIQIKLLLNFESKDILESSLSAYIHCSDNIIILEMITKLYLEYDHEIKEIEVIINSLSSLKNSSVWLLLYKCYQEIINFNFHNAKILIEDIVEGDDHVISLNKYKCEIYFYMKNYDYVVKYAQKVLGNIGSKYFGDRNDLENNIISLVLKSGFYLKALDFLPYIIDISKKSLIKSKQNIDSLYAGFILLKYGYINEITELLSEYKSIPEDARFHYLRSQYFICVKDMEAAKNSLQKGLDIDSQDEFSSITKVEYFWAVLKCSPQSQTHKTDVFSALIEAIKLQPEDALLYNKFGLLYENYLNNQSKAAKCFEKAFNLYNQNEEIAQNLLKSLFVLNDKEKIVEYIKIMKCDEFFKKKVWFLNFSASFYYMIKEYFESISYLQQSIKISRDWNVYERLGDAYFKANRLQSALRLFQLIYDNNNSNIYSQIQIGKLKYELGELKESIDILSDVILQEPNNVAAIFALIKSYSAKILYLINDTLFIRAIDIVEQNVQLIIRGIHLNKNLHCFWKSLGDILTLLYRFPEENLKQFQLSVYFEEIEEIISNKSKILKCGEMSYLSCLKIMPNNSSIWKNLAINLFYQSMVINCTESKQLIFKSYQAMQKAITIKSDDYSLWDSLGVISASPIINDAALSQNNFMKSLSLNKNNSFAWTNLGVLYLKHDNRMLAHKAFSKAQAIDPEYTGCWIGQSIIAEKENILESIDLSRHCLLLSRKYPQLNIGAKYGNYITNLLLSEDVKLLKSAEYAINDLHAVEAAVDALTYYTASYPNDAIGLNFLAFLYSKQNLNQSALDTFKKCEELLQTKKNYNFLTRVKLNMANVFIKMGNYTEANMIFEDNLKDKASFRSLCAWALCLFHLERFTEALHLLKRAEEICNDNEKMTVSLSIAICMYKNNDMEAAKTQLFKDISKGKHNLDSLQLLLRFFIERKDLKGVEVILIELKKLDAQHILSLPLLNLRSDFYAIKNKKEDGCRDYYHYIHKFPYKIEYYLAILQYILSWFDQLNFDVPLLLVTKALQMVEKSDQKEYIKCYNLILINCSHDKLVFCEAQTYLHSYPDDICGKLIFVHHLVSKLISCQKYDDKFNEYILSYSYNLLQLIEIDKRVENLMRDNLYHWMYIHYLFILIMLDHHQEAVSYIEKALWCNDKDILFSKCASFIPEYKANHEKLITIIKNMMPVVGRHLAIIYYNKNSNLKNILQNKMKKIFEDLTL